jgi:hypothetical protein
MQTIEQILKSYASISLDDLKDYSLQDRTDTKFILPIQILPKILSGLKGEYSLLRILDKEINDYETVYYDTPSLSLYLAHHNEKGNRYKVRLRKYLDSGLCFFEIKFKNSKERTLKYRILQPGLKTNLTAEAINFLQLHSPLKGNDLTPQITIRYSRLTLISLHSKERLTFDLQLSANREGFTYSFGNVVVAELKQEHNGASPFRSAMKQAGVRTASLSKYCLGLMVTYPGIKSNKFKQTLLTIQKIAHVI